MGEDICIQFVGPKGEYDKLLTRTKNSKSSHIFGRAWVVYQWMAVLKKLHCLYKSEPALVSLNEMKRRIKQTVGILLSQTINTFDDACLNAMNIARDDVAEIRASSTNNRLLPASDDPCQKKDNVDSFAVNDEAPLALRYCYVTNSDKTTHGSKSDSTHEYLSGAARTIRMDVEEERRSYSERVNMSRRSVAPMDEFTQSNEILTGSNPDVFILGNAYGRTKGALSEKEATHLLLQFTNNASSCRTLLFLLFDQRQRHSVIGQMHVKIRQDAAAFEKFTKLFTSEGFQTKLRMGIANPEGKQAKEVLKKLIPVLTSGGKKTVFGALERRAAAGEILAMGRAYGAASNFLTVSVDDVHTPGVFRLAFRSCNNMNFPALCPDTLLDAMEVGENYDIDNINDQNSCIHGEKCLGRGSVPIPCDWSSLAEKATDNPVSVAVHYKKLIHDLMTILVGIRPGTTSGENNRTLTTSFGGCGPDNIGVITGTAAAFIGVTETTGKGSLHFHVVIWGGLSPDLLQNISGYPELCKEAAKTLNSMYCATLPTHVHVRDLVSKGLALFNNSSKTFGTRKKRKATAMKVPPDPRFKRSKFRHYVHDIVCYCGIHTHCMTCRKPPKGWTRCRLSKPSGFSAHTEPVQLIDVPLPLEESDISSVIKRSEEVKYEVIRDIKKFRDVHDISETDLSEANNSAMETDAQQQPKGTYDPLQRMTAPDDRLIVWEIERPRLNGLPSLSEFQRLHIQHKKRGAHRERSRNESGKR